MTKICADCKKEFTPKSRANRAKRCPECAYGRLKSKVRARMHRVRRELFGPLLKDRLIVHVTAKCPRCEILHVIEMRKQPSIMPRIFCPRHEILKTAAYYDAWNDTAVRV